MYLLDTNAISEPTKKVPNSGYMKWLAASEPSALFTSSLVIGELQKGVNLASKISRASALQKFVDKTKYAFEAATHMVDTETALIWADITSELQTTGRTLPVVDSILAAQCIQHNLTLVTRNKKDFAFVPNLKVLCPWN